MQRFFLRIALLTAAFPLAGCARLSPRPVKIVESPAGGEPILTAAERAASPRASRRQAGIVAPASFEQPVGEPQPLKPLAQWSEQDAAADALGRIGAAAVPALVEALQSRDRDERLKAIEVLGRMGSDAKDAVPDLVRLLDDLDPSVRKAAARTLGRIGPAAQEAVPALIRTLLQTAPQPPEG